MTTRRILYFLTVVVGLIFFILLYDFYTNAYHLWAGIFIDLLFTSFVVLFFYVIFSNIFRKLDKKFAEEIDQKNIQEAVKFFKDRQLPDGVYFESVVLPKESLFSKFFGWFMIFLMAGMGIFFIIFNNMRNYQLGGYILAIIFIIIGIIGFINNIIKTYKDVYKIDLGGYKKFRLYKDKFILLPQNKTFSFEDIEYLKIFIHYDQYIMNIHFDKKSHYFYLNYGTLWDLTAEQAGTNMQFFMQYLGFKKTGKIYFFNKK